ncbi:MAG TPA: hypothetical protein VGL04_02185 [Sporichthyaceae bacterium]
MSARRYLALGTTVAFVGAGVLGIGGTANAQAPQSTGGTRIYDLSSEAVAVQSTATDPGAPFGIPLSIGSYGASSVLNSNGESTADSGAPYSPLVFSLPNTGNGLFQGSFGFGLPVVPTFPGYVSAKDPVLPTDQQNAGGYQLDAMAEPAQARGDVSMGGQAATSAENNAFAYANSVVGDDNVLSEGGAGVHALTLGGILDVANVSSHASLTKTDGGRAVPTTSTDLGTVTFAHLRNGVSADGFSAFGSGPVPLHAEGLGALNDALKPAGIRFTYLPEVYTYTDGSTTNGPKVDAKKEVAGITSGALQIFLTNTSDRGTTTDTITIGRVAVAASSSSVGGASSTDTGSSPVGAGVTPGVSGPSAADPSTAVAGSATPAAVDATAATPPTNNFVASGRTPTRMFLPAAAVTGQLDGQGTTSFRSAYLLVVLAGAGVLIGGRLVRAAILRRTG